MSRQKNLYGKAASQRDTRRALLAVTDVSQRQELARRVIDEGLSVRQIEAATQQSVTGRKARRPFKAGTESVLPELVEELQQALGTKVRIVRQGTGGRFEIEFYDDDDITRIYELIVQNQG